METNLYAIGQDLYTNNDHCGCCADTSSYNNLRCYIENTFQELPNRDTLRNAVTADGSRLKIDFKKLVCIVKSGSFEETLEENARENINGFAFYYFAELTKRQADWIANKTDLDAIDIDQLANEQFVSSEIIFN